MKVITLLLFLIPVLSFGQQTFKDSSGVAFEVRELARWVPYDSCVILCHDTSNGWAVANPGQLRQIYDQHLSLKDDSYFTLKNDEPTEATWRFGKYSEHIAESTNINSPKFYHLIMIKRK